MKAVPILLVDHASALGGAEHFLLSLLASLDRDRFVPHLAAPPGHLADAALALGLRVHAVRLDRLRHTPAWPWRLARGVAELARVVRRERIVLVQANTMRASLYAACAAQLMRRPLVWHVHELFPPGVYVRRLCRLCTAAIAVSRAAAAPLPCAGKVRVIPNGVRLADFHSDRRAPAARLRQAWGVPHDAVLVGQVARLQPSKGQRDVIAAAELLRDLPRVYVAIVGGDIFGDAHAYEQELRDSVGARGLAERVIFTGHVNDVPTLMHALDIVVHASHNDAFGRILIEAGAAARPVVAYASGAVAEIMQHETSGLVVPLGDRAALAAALRRLVLTPVLAKRLGENARTDVGSRFDLREVTRRIEDVFERVSADA